MKNLFAGFASSALLVACSAGSQNLGTNDGDGGTSTAQNGSGAGGSASGVFAGKTFVPTSALAHGRLGLPDGPSSTEEPVIDLIFSSEADVCSTSKNGQVLVGETYVNFLEARAAVGPNVVGDANYYVISKACVSGTKTSSYDNGGADSASRIVSPGATVTFTRVDAERVEGTVSAKFEDLSSFEGSFSLVPCTGSGSSGFGDSPTCK